MNLHQTHRVDAMDNKLWRTPLIRILPAAMLALGCAAGAHAQWVTPEVTAPRVQYHTFESAAAGAVVSYHVYTPPEYDTHPERRFPTLYWLHGAGSPTNGIAPLSAWFGSAIADGRIPPMLVVFPNGMNYRMWCDSKNGLVPMETVVIEDLLPEIDASFRTIDAREGRIIEGFSMGGYGAGRLGLRNLDLFTGVSMLGAGPMQLDFLDAPPGSTIPWKLRLQIYEQVYGSDPEYFLAQSPWVVVEQNAQAIMESGVKLRLAVGQLDFVAPDNLEFQQHITGLGLPHEFFYPEDIDHSPLQLMAAMGEANWDFYRDLFGGLCCCPADLNGDGLVGSADLSALLGSWGPCPGCAADLDGDGVVGAGDLAALLGSWGPCP
ncbi:MAG: esterase family protein [Phycisphaeraceae bacterium]|nr:MAG: esterase family protein [Phycisphaeraceae bacterium]